MSLMDRLDAILDDADQLLAQADDQTVDEALARGEAPDHLDVDDSCPWCHHGFHGLPCAPAPTFTAARPEDFWGEIDTYSEHLTAPDPDWDCRCDSARTRPDDTWRPLLPWRDRRLLEHMDRTGLDGWAAAADLRPQHPRPGHQLAQLGQTFELFAAAADRAAQAVGEAIANVAVQWQSIETVIGGRGFGRGGRIFIAPIDTPPPSPLAGQSPAHVTVDELLTPPPTVMERALQQRRTRNTGPDQPSAGQARRPRTHRG